MGREEVVFRVELTEGGVSGSPSPGDRGGDDFSDVRARNRQKEAQREQQRRAQMAELQRLARQGKLDESAQAALAGLQRQFGDDSPAAAAARARRPKPPPAPFRGNPFVVPPPLPGDGGGGASTGRTASSAAGRAFAASSAAHSAAVLGLGGAAASGAAAAATSANPAVAAAIVVGLGAAAAAATPPLLVFGAGLKAASEAFKEIERLGEVNVEVARAQAERELRDIRGRIRRGGLIGDEAADFLTARSQLQQAVLDAGAEILDKILPLLTDLVDLLTSLINLVTPIIGPLLEALSIELQAALNAILTFFANSPIGWIFKLTGAQEVIEALLREARRKRDLDEALEAKELERTLDFFDPEVFLRNLPQGIGGV